MAEHFSKPTYRWNFRDSIKIKKDRPIINLALFLITFVTTVIAGAEWATGSLGQPMEFSYLVSLGLPYAISILFFLSAHEFGHYFAARYHGINASLPYYIPFPPIPIFINFGTMGAVIKTRSQVPNNKIMFDIGVAGPIAGFIASLIILTYGFMNVPPVEYILAIHPDYFSPEYGMDGLSLRFGDTILFSLFREIFVRPGTFFPPMTEIYHYPYLCVGWFGLFVTTMNMIPIGQLDGGHIVYSMLGEKRHESIASVFLILLVVMGVVGIVDTLMELNLNVGWSGWLFWGLILYFIIKVKHPPVAEFERLSTGRMILGYISLIILFLSFSPSPLVLSLPPGI